MRPVRRRALWLEGFASRFWEPDLGGDLVARGAFRETLGVRPATRVRLLHQHDPDAVVGAWIGLKETEDGLWARGVILPDTVRARQVQQQILDGRLQGLSIGYRTRRARKGPGGRRVLSALELLEVSLVTTPMLPSARIRAHGWLEPGSVPFSQA
ncbi:MAG: HK97 family phage prohead protease [Asticcacaulis sp.]